MSSNMRNYIPIENMKDALKEKTVAAVILGDEGTLLIQCGNKMSALGPEISPKYAASLMKLVGEAFEL
ncbi:hypothetical protein ACPV4Y_15980 [Vibrio harveyi]